MGRSGEVQEVGRRDDRTGDQRLTNGCCYSPPSLTLVSVCARDDEAGSSAIARRLIRRRSGGRSAPLALGRPLQNSFCFCPAKLAAAAGRADQCEADHDFSVRRPPPVFRRAAQMVLSLLGGSEAACCCGSAAEGVCKGIHGRLTTSSQKGLSPGKRGRAQPALEGRGIQVTAQPGTARRWSRP